MFGHKSPAEWAAETEKLQSEIAAVKYQQVERGLRRERQKLKLEDHEDRLLQIQLRSKENAVAIAEAKLQGEEFLVKSEKSRTKYLEAKHRLTERGFGLELEIQGIELAKTEEKLRQLKAVATTLNYRLQHSPTAALGGNHG